MVTPRDLTHARGDDSDFMSRYTVVAAPQPARIVLSPLEKNWNLSIGSVHVAAALKHHFTDKDTVLLRMLPFHHDDKFP